jgi:hypothetical protein
MPDIDVRAVGPHEYAVVVTEGGQRTRHTVRVPQRLLDDLGIARLDEERLVRESFAFLLEREPAGAILREFDLDVISRYFPEYPRQIGDRFIG